MTALGPITTDYPKILISPDGSRVALVGNAGSRQAVFIDGNQGPPYSSLGEFLQISADGSRVAYTASKGSEWVMVVNHKEGPPFDSISAAWFSPVGHRLAYLAHKGNLDVVVTDSTVSPGYAGVRGGREDAQNGLMFSADGQHVGYVAWSTGKQPGQFAEQNTFYVVVDGKPSPAYTGGVTDLRFGPNGHFAYITPNLGNETTNNRMLIDGRPGPTFAAIKPAVFSADGSHVAYLAESGRRKWVAVRSLRFMYLAFVTIPTPNT